MLNVEANVEVDFTALEAVNALRDQLTSAGTVFALARVKQDLLDRLQAFGLASKIGAGSSPPCPRRWTPTRSGRESILLPAQDRKPVVAIPEATAAGLTAKDVMSSTG